jgi:hypothetical protein
MQRRISLIRCCVGWIDSRFNDRNPNAAPGELLGQKCSSRARTANADVEFRGCGEFRESRLRARITQRRVNLSNLACLTTAEKAEAMRSETDRAKRDYGTCKNCSSLQLISPCPRHQ